MDTFGQKLNELLEQFLAGFLEVIPQLLLALLTFVAGFIVAKVAQRLIKQFILYLHRNINARLGQRSLNIDLEGSAVFISKALFWIIIVFFIALIIQILEFSVLSKWIDGLIVYLPNLIGALVIVFTGIIVGRLVKDLIISATVTEGISTGENVGSLARYVILIIAVIIAIDQVGIDIVFLTNIVDIILAALLFGAALAFGLGARTSVSNILGSYYLQKNYQEGDTIQVGEVQGVIVKITATTIFLDTKSGQVAIPAKDFNEEKVTLVKKS